MGCVAGISHDVFPVQSGHVGKVVEVCFNYNFKQSVPGRIVRDDRAPPFETIIKLTDGRFVRAVECQFTYSRC